MAKKKNESIIYHGEIIDRSFAESHTFPIGCKFHYNNASYDDVFTVVGIKKEPGTEYRQVLGAVAGEVWMLLTSLQKETALGAIKILKEESTKEKKNTNKKKIVKKSKK
jgi:hypothetical protein